MFLKLFKEGFIFAVKSIVVNKLRTLLSLLGITIGIFCIISVFTVLDWMEKSIRDSVSSLGNNVIYVQKFPWSFDPNLAWWDIIKWPSISENDFQAIQKKSTKSETACLLAFQPEKVKYRKNIANDINVVATTIEFQEVRSFEINNGRYFSPFEASKGKNVALLGHEIARRLFDNTDPIGKEISIAGFKTLVIGVLKKEGKGGIGDNGMDDLVIVPLSYGKTFINMKNPFIESQLMIKAKPDVNIQELGEETTMILRAARRLSPEETTNFSVNRASMLSQGLDAIFVAINLGGWVIGGFSILVGGFGIANIMFVSVRERTNIIGIQKALGAKKFFILQQFLVESMLLSVLGGLLGVLMVFLTTLVVNYFYDLNIYLTVANIFLAIFISGIIGIVAGYAPANSASKMNPVEAIGFSF